MAVVAVAGHGRSDLPPPADKKFVGYGFRVDNTNAFPDYVLLAFPWSLSNGAPTKEHALVEEGKTVSLGRRSSPPELYVMKRAEYETWKAGYKPTMEYQDPALDALFASKQVVRCDVKLSPEFLLAKDDPRSQVVEAFRAEVMDATTCRIAKVDAKPSTPTPAQPQPQSEPVNAPAPAPAPAPTKARGCGGCTTQPADDDSAFVLAGVFALVASLRRGGLRRRRP